MTLQRECQGGVAIWADARDAEMPVVVSKGEKFGRMQDGNPLSCKTPSPTNRTQQDVIFTHARITLSIHPSHRTLQRAIWRES